MCSRLFGNFKELAGLPALQGGEPGQVRKEAAIPLLQVPGARLASLFETGVAMKKICVLIGAILLNGNVWAIDGVSAEIGSGDKTNMARIGAQWDWQKKWFTDGNWLVTGYWEASAGRWNGQNSPGNNHNITDVGFTPVFRLQQKNLSGLAPYLEAGIGVHLISDIHINADRRFSTAFQFGDHLGTGLRFGVRKQFDLGYRFQHLSNGSIKHPNPGINFSQIRLAYHF